MFGAGGGSFRRVAPSKRDASEEDEEPDEPHKPVGRVGAIFQKMPAGLIFPVFALLTVAFLVAAMLPVYVSFIKINQAQDEALIWPLGAREAELDEMDQFNAEMDLIQVYPEAREATFLFDLNPGGTYEHDTEAGLLELDGLSLALTLGHQHLDYASGSAVSDLAVTFIMEDTSPLYFYPYDKYEIDIPFRANLVNDSNQDAVTSTAAAVGMVLFEGEQGWETSSTLLPMYNLNGELVPGVTIHMTFQRSGSVKFFSMFIVILMWAISLAMFVIGLNYFFSPSLDVAYDVPGLAVALLFALPFVRTVMPNVPTVGIVIDIMGFFFNMILIAIATVMVMAAITSRHFRSLRRDRLRKEAARARKLQLETPSVVSEPPTSKQDDDVEMQAWKGEEVPVIPSPSPFGSTILKGDGQQQLHQVQKPSPSSSSSRRSGAAAIVDPQQEVHPMAEAALLPGQPAAPEEGGADVRRSHEE